MEYIHVSMTSLGSLVVLFLLTKVMGYKQLSQLSMFDYITGITIGSIAAEMAISLENDFKAAFGNGYLRIICMAYIILLYEIVWVQTFCDRQGVNTI